MNAKRVKNEKKTFIKLVFMFIFALIITIKKGYFLFLNDKNKEEKEIKR